MAFGHRKRPIRRFITIIVCAALAAHLAGCLVLYFEQDSLIFQGAVYQGKSVSNVIAPPGCEIIHLTTADGDHVAAIYGTALLPDGKIDLDASHRRTLLYFYGNGGAIFGDMGEFKQFRLLDVNVLMPDFVGYGMSSGKPSEANLYATAAVAFDYLTRTRGVKSKRIVSVGWSLGAAVAIDLAARKSVAGLVVFNAFTTLDEMAHRIVPYVPTDLILKYRFDNLAKIKSIVCPIFICNGLKDTLVPAEMSDRLAAAAKGPVTRVRVAEADHNGIFSADPEAVFPALGRFLDGLQESGTADKRR